MDRPIAALAHGALRLAGWTYVAITALICFDIVARRLMGFSTEATTELTGYLMAVGMTWGLAGTLLERGHVRIDVLVQQLPLRVRVWLHLASLAALLVATGFLTFGAVRLAWDSFQIGATDISALRTPLVLPQGLWAGGLALLLLTVIALCAQALRQLTAGQHDELDQALMARSYLDEAAETLEALGEGGDPPAAHPPGDPPHPQAGTR